MVQLHTNYGVITLELFADKAPATVENFLSYVKDGFFDGTIFHRVIPGFMVQGGGFTSDMQQKPTKAAIKNEANNQVANTIGTIAMARTSDPHSATCQFFINVADNDFLNFRAENSQGWGYCVFGKVTAGMDVVEKITAVQTGRHGPHADVPTEPVVIERAELND
ncbi:peptidylprolyl isomerase [Alkalimonas sp.]|uniref:peptidylprolyl isomerase n=1 Tax=Alkalimonas sp. TaxID=1872453 RepID=UPI00263A674B|nr:peptidylprolyl isomerase [Alkalimonas sp.]MCC5824966.1 peptidylprolyl isomerase [Alkalimonas sp.]